MPTFEVIYYAKFACLDQVEAPTKAQAKELLYKHCAAKGGLTTLSVKRIEEVVPVPKQCFCDRGFIAVGEYDAVKCTQCDGTGLHYAHVIKD